MLQDLLQKRRDSILERWLNLILESFPSDSHGFFKLEMDQFRNPVGHRFREETAVLLRALTEDDSAKPARESLNRIVRIRAVQDCRPSEAIAFVFLLKNAIREELSDELGDESIEPELSELESRIDRLAMVAFDGYMMCREQIYEIRARADKMRTAKLLERLNQSHDDCQRVDDIHREDV